MLEYRLLCAIALLRGRSAAAPMMERSRIASGIMDSDDEGCRIDDDDCDEYAHDKQH